MKIHLGQQPSPSTDEWLAYINDTDTKVSVNGNIIFGGGGPPISAA